MEYLKMNNERLIPQEGLGTFQLSPEEAERSCEAALKDGYRLIDTANYYMNERAVGRAIKNSGVKREDIFLSTKLWPTEYDKGMKVIDETLKRLGTDYVDLLFLHQPVGHYMTGYKLMEQAVLEGKVRSLGLSNFPIGHLREIWEHAERKPQVVQVECHPYDPRNDLRKYLNEHGMVLMAWYPLGHGDKTLLDEPIFTKLAKKYGKSNVQIILRWHVQIGDIVIPGSKNPDHVRENFDIWDFELTADEMAEIATLDKGVLYFPKKQETMEKEFMGVNLDFDKQQ